MKILLTGGSGFIGRNIRQSYLADKYEIAAPSRQQLDLTDEQNVADYFAANPVDVVIHAACKPGHRNAKDPTNLLYINNLMFNNLSKQSYSYQKLFNIGSGAVYDKERYKPRMPEDYAWEVLPADELGLSKHLSARKIEESNNMVDLRVFGIFGPYEDYAIRFISNAICKTLFDLPITLKQNRRFDYLWIGDFITILDKMLEGEPQHKAYNITPDDTVELLDLAHLVRDVSGKDLPIQVAQEGVGSEYSGDNSRLQKEFGPLEFTPIRQAVEELYQWYAVNKDEINPQLLLQDK